jgi:hypothetical protein
MLASSLRGNANGAGTCRPGAARAGQHGLDLEILKSSAAVRMAPGTTWLIGACSEVRGAL